MESVNEIKEALSARSRTATLDELRSEGKKKVRLIRAEQVAAMVVEAVHAAIEQSGLIDPKEAERLVEKSRVEFRSILREREQEAQHAHDVEQKLATSETQLRELGARSQELSAALADTRVQLEAAGAESTRHRDEVIDTRAEVARCRSELEQAHGTIAELQEQVAQVQRTPAPVAAQGPGTDLLMSLVNEMASMKANLMNQQAQERAPAAATAGAEFSAAIDKLSGTLNDRLEKLGKKMGVSAAVDGDAVDFGGMFKDTGKLLESNMENIEVKQKAGGGIAANLARLKKLKGGG